MKWTRDHEVVPEYLARTYGWAYGNPRAISVLDRRAVVECLLYGHYAVLRDATRTALAAARSGRVLQLGCCYGDLTPRLVADITAAGGQLDVVDALTIQLERLAQKLPPGAPVRLARMNAESLGLPSGRYDAVFAFMLLHEMPPQAVAATLAEARRVLAPGGKLVLVEFGPPSRLNPIRLWLPLLGLFEPYAAPFWHRGLAPMAAAALPGRRWQEQRFGDGLLRLLQS